MEFRDTNPLFQRLNPIIERLKTIKRNDPSVDIEYILREINLWEKPQIQLLYRQKNYGTDFGRARATEKLLDIIQIYYDLRMRLGDKFMPYATAEQINNDYTGIHVLNQAYNGIAMYAPFESLPLCWLILGPQGGGKSSAAFNMLRQFDGPFILLDPKGTWRFRARQLNAEYIDDQYICIDESPPSGIELIVWLYSSMEGVAAVTGLQFGLSCLYEACDIAVEQFKRYIEHTGQETALSLKDIYCALYLCRTDNPKQKQYLESAKTALHMLIGNFELFANRGGLPLDELLNGRYILSCRHLTAVQSRMLAWHILNYEYYRSYKLPETTEPRGLIVFDDSSKFISRPDNVFGTGSRTSPYLHLLSTLRSTGKGAIFIDQLVEPICDDIKQLCNNWLIVGGMRGTHNQNEIASAMSLTDEQAQMLGRMQRQEAVCFCPMLYQRAIHGFIPDVPEPEENIDD